MSILVCSCVLFLLCASHLNLAWSAPCATFSQRCMVTMGSVQGDLSGQAPIQLGLGKSVFYSFTPTVDIEYVDLEVVLFFGNIEIFGAQGREPKKSNYDFSNVESGSIDKLRIRYSTVAESRSTPTNVQIVAVGGSASFFAWVMGPDTREIIIPANAPIRATLLPGQQLSFKRQIQSVGQGALSLSLYQGSYPLLELRIPSQSSSLLTSDGYVDFVVAQSDVGNSLIGSFASQNTSSMVIVLRENAEDFGVRLGAGMSIRDRVEAAKSRLFTFYVPMEVTGVVTFTLDTFYGDADMYINPDGSEFYKKEVPDSSPPVWTSQRPGIQRDSITVHPDDPNYVENGVYYVSVYGYVGSEFNVRVSLSRSVQILSLDSPIVDTAVKGEYKYYQIVESWLQSDIDRSLILSSSEREYVIVDVAPINGDADLFVSCSLKNNGLDEGFPSKLANHHNYSSSFYGEDAIVLSPVDSRACISSRTPLEVNQVADTLVSLTYNVAVYAYSTATYALTTSRGGGVITLLSGIPVKGRLFRGQNSIYRLRVGSQSKGLQLTLFGMSGCEMFVSFDQLPSTWSFEFRSSSVGSSTEILNLDESLMCTDCFVYILIHAFESSSYSLMGLFSDSTMLLSNGVPLRSSVAEDQTQYFSYLPALPISDTPSTVRAVVTVFSGMSPVMSLSTKYQRPNSSSPSTVVTPRGIEVVPTAFISVHQGDYVYIGVAGDGSNISFSIRVDEYQTADIPVVLPLMNGQPQADELKETDGDNFYYSVTVPPGHEELVLRVQPLVGTVSVYARRCSYASLRDCVNTTSLPSSTHYSFSISADQIGSQSLLIGRSDVATAHYLICVHSVSRFAAWRISSALTHTIVELQAGITVIDRVTEGEVDYFSFYFQHSGKGDLQISLLPIYGDPDLFVSATVRHPSMMNSTWRSVRFGADTLSLSRSQDDQVCNYCTYYIAVYGSSESMYSLTVSEKDTVVSLSPGIPVTGRVNMMEWDWYSFAYDARSPHVLTLSLSPSTGNADIYISLDGNHPSFQQFDYASRNFFSSDTILIQPSIPPFSESSCAHSSNCSINIGVYGFTASDYQLVLSSSSVATLLPLNRALEGRTNAVDPTNYKVSLPKLSVPYSVVGRVAVQSGRLSLFASCSQYPTNASNSMWIMSPANSDSSMEISSLTLIDKKCLSTENSNRDNFLYLSAVAQSSQAIFTISMTLSGNSSTRTLVASQPFLGSIPRKQLDYFVVHVHGGSQQQFLTASLQLSVLSGDADMYISRNWEQRARLDPTSNTVVSFDRSSSNWGDDSIELSHSTLQSWCLDRGDNCYFMVAVLGGSTVPASYSLQLAWADSAIVLLGGIPHRGQVNSLQTEYYKFSIVQRNVDVVFSVSALSGDPDMYVSLAPNRHPGRFNYTWAQALFGSDVLTIQARDVDRLCSRSSALSCDFFVGVYGWRNSTFSILAMVNDQFRTPSLLIDQLPQSASVQTGEYYYFRYKISIEPMGPHSKSQPLDIKFTLTSMGDGDLDLYAKFTSDGNFTEPGQSNYDIRSTNWGSISDTITITPSSSFYCVDCTVLLAVYGYRGGDFSLQASSRGMITLQPGDTVGGNLMQSRFDYYSFYNIDPFAEILISLSAVVGDADLYVLARKRGDPLTLPSRSHFTWRSMQFGADTLSIDYSDPSFCHDCEYVAAVFAYNSNCSYSLTLAEREASVIRLLPNHPVTLSMDNNELLHFSTRAMSSVSDITVALSPLNTGTADIFVKIINGSLSTSLDSLPMPNPDDYSTYDYTTQGTEDNHVYLPRPHSLTDIVMITVVASSDVTFSMVASHSTRPLLLLPGLQQTHYVQAGLTALFDFYPDSDDDVRVTLTARSGDPDLFISATDVSPTCAAPEGQPWRSSCSNYTWSSRLYSTDQIVISADTPCSPVIPSTQVSANCDPAMFPRPAHSPLKIAVFGYRDSKFALSANVVSSHTALTAGIPTLSSTSPGTVCSQRTETGSCTSSSSRTSRVVQASYFSFTVAPSDAHKPARKLGMNWAMSEKDFLLSVVPIVNCSTSTVTSSTCSPGCVCNPLLVYISSCPVSKCSHKERKPSLFAADATFTVAPDGSTMFLTSTDQSKGFCDPDVVNEDCIYYIAVSHTDKSNIAAFSLTARTPTDLSLIPCDGRKYPDGVRAAIRERVSKDPRFFEICSQNARVSDSFAADGLVIELQQCSGRTSLYACADDGSCSTLLPSITSYRYFADSSMFCTHYSDKSQRDKCTKSIDGRVRLSVPARVGSYFVMANGTGEFSMNVRAIRRNTDLTPSLMFAGSFDSSVSVTSLHSETATLHFRKSQMFMPGLSRLQDPSELLTEVYLINFDKLSHDAEMDFRKSLMSYSETCALELAMLNMPSSAVVVRPVIPQAAPTLDGSSSDFVTIALNGLEAEAHYGAIVVATCDGFCLRQLSKVITSPRVLVNCNSGDVDCNSQSLMYSLVEFTTQVSDASSKDNTGNSGSGTHPVMMGFAIILGIAVVAALCFSGLVVYKSLSAHDNQEATFWERAWDTTQSIWAPIANHFTSSFSPLPSSSVHGRPEATEGVAMTTFSSNSSDYVPPKSSNESPPARSFGIMTALSSTAKKFQTFTQSMNVSTYAKLERPGSAFVLEDEEEDVTISL